MIIKIEIIKQFYTRVTEKYVTLLALKVVAKMKISFQRVVSVTYAIETIQ